MIKFDKPQYGYIVKYIFAFRDAKIGWLVYMVIVTRVVVVSTLWLTLYYPGLPLRVVQEPGTVRFTRILLFAAIIISAAMVLVFVV